MSEKSVGNVRDTSLEDTGKDAFPGLDHLTKEGYKLLMNGIKQANLLPTGRDWNFYCTFDSFKSAINEEANSILDSINSVLRKNEIGGNMQNRTIEAKTEILIDANDSMLERIADNIDEMNGIRKCVKDPVVLHSVSAQLPVNINGSWNKSGKTTFSVSSTINLGETVSPQSNMTTIRLLTAENILRPQKFFKDKIDNSNQNPWEPRIKEKPNSLKPLAIFLEETEKGHEYSHPYLYELDRFTPSECHLIKTKVTKPKFIQDTPLIEINKPEQLPDLLEDLHKHNIIAIDLEHHSYRTFMGITCLMQISTCNTDYLIDTLALRSELWVLNEIFTKPTVIKVFHGAVSDIQWLQRDLSLYIVNMFDTYFAAKQLGYSSLSLASLMQRFCSFVPNKQFQLADWRIRPLPQELKNYAREDTHYLIFIYENMRNELLQKANGCDNLIRAVIQESTELCKQKYFKPIWHEEIHLEFYRRCNRMFDNRQLFALKELYKWRDTIARDEDESNGYVLPNNMLLEIAERLPKEMQGILACCNPVPPLVRANLLDLHKIILKALEVPFEQPILKEDIRARGTTKKMTKINVDSPLHCPHDLTKTGEYRDDLPTLLGTANHDTLQCDTNKTINIEKTEYVCSVFNTPENSDDEMESRVTKLSDFRKKFKFLSPFERYQLVKPFIEAKEKKLAEERAKEKEEATRKQTENETTVGGDDIRTDEERIESIRTHFLKLARQSIETEPQSNRKLSLIEMGGSKKRKRAESNLHGHVHPKGGLVQSSLHTTVPNLPVTSQTNTNIKKLGNAKNRESYKRKSSDADVNSNLKQVPEVSIKRRKKRENKELHNQVQGSQENTGVVQEQKEDASVSGVAPQESDYTTGNYQSQSNLEDSNLNTNNATNSKSNSNKPFKGNNRRRKRGHQDGRKFNAYDYSLVDFRQFQGGGQGIKPQKQFKSKFIPRGKSKGANRNRNKSMTFDQRKGL